MRRAAPPTLRYVMGGCAFLSLALLPLGGCGAADGLPDLGLGTVFVANQTNLGMAPLTVTQFFIAPVGDTNPGDNRLGQPLDPGDIQTLGLFFEGTYNAVAVLESGLNVNFPPREVRSGEPTTFVIPGP